MDSVEAYKILKEHKTNQDRLIREKVIGLFIANSFMLTAFFLLMQSEANNGRFTLVRYILAGFVLTLCCGFAVSLASDNRAKLKTAAGLEEIEKLTVKRDVEGLIKELQKANYCDAAEGLRQIGDKRAVVPLLKAFEDHAAKGEVCINLVNTLGEFGDERAVDPLIKMLPHTLGEACLGIVNALGQIGDERAIKALIEVCGDEVRGRRGWTGLMEETVGLAARDALRRIGKPAVKPLIEAFEDNAAVSYYACKVLGELVMKGQLSH